MLYNNLAATSLQTRRPAAALHYCGLALQVRSYSIPAAYPLNLSESASGRPERHDPSISIKLSASKNARGTMSHPRLHTQGSENVACQSGKDPGTAVDPCSKVVNLLQKHASHA